MRKILRSSSTRVTVAVASVASKRAATTVTRAARPPSILSRSDATPSKKTTMMMMTRFNSTTPTAAVLLRSQRLQLQQQQQRHMSGGGGGGAAVAGADGLLPFNLADIGEGIAEVEILQWFVKAGDEISAFDRICEVQSDKATVEITSRYNGVVKELCWKVGEMAKVGQPLIFLLSAGGGSAPPTTPAPVTPTSTATPAAASSASSASSASLSFAPTTHTPTAPQHNQHLDADGSKVLAVPAVRRIAKENNVDLAHVAPTGKGGRVTKEDVLAYIESGGNKNNKIGKQASSGGGGGAGGAVVQQEKQQQEQQQQQQQQQQQHRAPAVVETSDTIHPLRGYNRAMVKSMTVQGTVPHFGFGEEVEMDNVVDLRNRLKGVVEERSVGTRFSYMPIMVKALSLALLEYPELNAKANANQDALIHKAAHNIGIAMDTPNGLVVPNIKNVQQKSMIQIAEELTRLTQAARENKIPAGDLVDGTITLSNIGVVAGTYCSPVLMPGELCIAALGRLQRVPRYNEAGELVPTTIMRISWSADHRYVDGMTVALFHKRWQQLLQNPDALLLAMK